MKTIVKLIQVESDIKQYTIYTLFYQADRAGSLREECNVMINSISRYSHIDQILIKGSTKLTVNNTSVFSSFT